MKQTFKITINPNWKESYKVYITCQQCLYLWYDGARLNPFILKKNDSNNRKANNFQYRYGENMGTLLVAMKGEFCILRAKRTEIKVNFQFANVNNAEEGKVNVSL